jgi:hypothetical protein
MDQTIRKWFISSNVIRKYQVFLLTFIRELKICYEFREFNPERNKSYHPKG